MLPGSWSLDALADRWQRATPFRHAVIDDAIPSDRVKELLAALDQEPADRIVDDIFEVMATAEPPVNAELRAFLAELGSPTTLAAVARITGREVSRADMRGYAYHPGHFLLPHADHREGLRREIAYALYLANLPGEGGFAGGELELFRVTVEGGEIVETEPARRLRPKVGRLVLMEVTPTSLHQVREVTAGTRVSLAGWFYR
jgi:Rps23 Pro-64 3,4-dihydroxylase Tpa1-like proline 4-hydroxylase